MRFDVFNEGYDASKVLTFVAQFIAFSDEIFTEKYKLCCSLFLKDIPAHWWIAEKLSPQPIVLEDV